MKLIATSLIGAALCFSSLQASAVPINVTGTATASGFQDVADSSAGPFDNLMATFGFTYDDSLGLGGGNFPAALTSLVLQIGSTVYNAANSSAVLTFGVGGVLTGVTVGGDANGGPTVSVPGTDDFTFSNAGGISVFRYTSAGSPPAGTLAGQFQTLSGVTGQVDVTFTVSPQALPVPATALLLVAGLGLLATQRRKA